MLYRLIALVLLGLSINSFGDELRLIIKYQNSLAMTNDRLNQLTQKTGLHLNYLHMLATGAHVIVFDNDQSIINSEQIIKQIKQDPDIKYVEVDKLLTRDDVSPNPDWQWDMGGNGFLSDQSTWVGDNFESSWQILNSLYPTNYIPGLNTIVGVIDTGYTPHPNFMNNLIALDESGNYGYQFISDCRISGNCLSSTSSNLAKNYPYQANALDLGDYVSQADINQSNNFFTQGCLEPKSSWHGSHVTGIIAADGYNEQNPTYITGGAYGAHVVPIRVLGKCGGYNSDIINGLMWASGYVVTNTNGTNLPINQHKVNVINMSLGGEGACSDALQEAIESATNAGVIVVVAGGNSAANILNYNPAGCNNVIAVAARGPTNKLSYYSNFGATTIAASGGDRTIDNCLKGSVDCLSSIYSTSWSSPEAYRSVESGGYGTFITYQGTSQATPHVSALALDLISYLQQINESYDFNIIKQIMQNTATTYSNCSFSGCAAGNAINAESAINYVKNGYNNYILSPSEQFVNFNALNESIVITFINHNPNAVVISDVKLLANGVNLSDMFLVESIANSCYSGMILESSGGSCVVSLFAPRLSDRTAGELKIIGNINESLVPISTVSLGYGVVTPSPPSTSVKSSGGCTMVKGSDDYGLYFLLIGIGIYIFGFRKITRGRVK